MADFSAPSFSLGLDLDFDSEPQTTPREESLCKQAQNSSSNVSFEPFEDDEDFQPKTLDPDLKAEEAPPNLKRLRRGHRTQPSVVDRRESIQFCSDIDDEIEDLSSQEDPRRDEQSPMQYRSGCSSSKLPLHGRRVLTTQSVSKSKAQKNTPASNASTSASLEASSNKLMFPKLTISPLRRFQLLDSDSDDPSASEDIHRYNNKTDLSAKGTQYNLNKSVTMNQQKRPKAAASSMLQTEDLWRDFSPKKTVNVPTPALDEFCEEYFKSVKAKNVAQRLDDGVCVSNLKDYNQRSNISKNLEPDWDMANPLPPAHHYFFHDDPRIQELVRSRLPNFSPLGAVNNRGNKQSDVSVIDYMDQFGQREEGLMQHGTGKNGLEGRSKRGRKNSKNVNVKEGPQVSGNWVTPKSCASIPKDAGKRRVHADGQSAGHWYTGPEGRKVYVTKNGQELTGQIAYRHYRKESKTGFKRSKKKATAKKKSKR